MVHGMHLQLLDIPKQYHQPTVIQFSDSERVAAQEQIDALLQKRATVPVQNSGKQTINLPYLHL